MKALAPFLALLLPLSLSANVTLPKVFSDGAVLQRGRPIPVWGRADAGEKVTVRLAGKSAETVASADGRWSVTLPELPAGGPYEIDVAGKNALSVKNVLVGEVWLVSGQSNVELPMFRLQDRYAREVAESRDEWVRQFKIAPAWDFSGPRDDFASASWSSADPKSVLWFSGVAYFFAKEIRERENVPVGIVNASLGGSPIESWLGAEALAPFPETLAEGTRWQNADLVKATTDMEGAAQKSWDDALDAADKGLDTSAPWYAETCDDSDWAVTPVPVNFADIGFSGSGSLWLRRNFDVPASLAGKEARINLGRIVDADFAWVNGVKVGNVTYQYPPRRYTIPAGILHEGKNTVAVRVLVDSGRGALVSDKPYEVVAEGVRIPLSGAWKCRVGVNMGNRPNQTFIQWKPTGLYNAMIAPLGAFPIAGVLWYQGESNTGTPELVAAYGPFMDALIAQYRRHFGERTPVLMMQLPNYMDPTTGPVESNWAQFRDGQRRALRNPGTALVVGIDLGDWNDIHPENKSDVGHRFALAARRLAYGESALASSGPLASSLVVENGKARVSFTEIAGGLVAVGGQDLRQFTLCGEDGVFHTAYARIDGDTVLVWSPDVPKPVKVRYAWADNPVGANLTNTSGLPASPFELSAQEAK